MDPVRDEKQHVYDAGSKIEEPVPSDFAPINASGHRQELERNFNLISICSFAITSGNCWVSLGGTVVSTWC